MDLSKVTGALTNARTELRNVVADQAKVMSNAKSSVADITAASKALNVAGKVDAALTRAEASIAKAVGKLTKPKRDRKKKTAEAGK